MIVTSTYFKRDFDVSKAELIGEGNFAQVFRIYDHDHADSLAIRRVDRHMGESEDIEKEKVINEELRRVENENILKIYDIVQTNKCVWYITEYCEGGSLWDALNDCKDNRMDQKDALQVVLQISKGVRELHNHRITHRDLKPQNILLKTKYVPKKPIPQLKLADFGLSTKKIIMETIAGTKQYIAPEQARFHNYTNAVDVWSLGIIFDEILHGTPFYVGDNNKQVFQKILKVPYKVRDQSIRPSIKQFLISILKKKPYERPIIASICQTIQKIILQVENKPLAHKNGDSKTDKKVVNFDDGNSLTPKSIPRNSNLQRMRDLSSQFSKQKQKEKKTAEGSSGSKRKIQRKETLQKDKNKPQLQSRRKSRQGTFYEDAFQVGRVPSSKRGMKTPPSNEVLMEATKLSPKANQQRLSMKRGVEQRKTFIKANNIPNSPRNSKMTDNFEEQVFLDLKQYGQKISNMKNQMQKTTLSIQNDREFDPSHNLTSTHMPQKFKLEEGIKKLKQDYNCLNFTSDTKKYQMDLLRGAKQLNVKKSRTQKKLQNYKKQLKEAFLRNIDQYIDFYIDKVIK